MFKEIAVIMAAGSVLALLAIPGHSHAEPLEKPAAGEAKEPARIRELMPPDRKDASRCFETRVAAEPIDIEDWSKVHWVQVEGQWSDGQPAKMPVAAVKQGKLKRILIQIVNDAGTPGDSGSRYTLWASVSLDGWKTKQLYTSANCSYQTNRLLFRNGDYVKDEKGEYISEPVTPQISCGVDCDGGGASLFYADGPEPAFRFQFHNGGMRMSGNCSVNNAVVGGEHDPDGEVKKSEHSPGYVLTELPAEACRGLERRAVDAMNSAGQ